MVVTANGTAPATTGEQKKRASHLRWLPLGQLIPAPKAQRDFQPAWANDLASNFNLEGMGFPVVSIRDNVSYIVDGQHRIAALRIVGFGPEDTIQCEVYEGLTEEAEAELFLERNNIKSVAALDKFRNALHAGRDIENAIDHVVRANGLHVGKRTRTNGAISAVGILRRVTNRQGLLGLGKVLRIVRDSYGTAGLEAIVLDGISLCLHRYDGQIVEEQMVERLSKTPGGLNGLLQPAEKTRLALGQPKVQCIAATAALIYNRDQRGKKLAPWWKE